MNSGNGLLSVLLLSGFLGSVGHCLGMCGPLVMMVGLQPSLKGRLALSYQLLYHAGRIAVYAMLGGIMGAIGSLLGLGPRLNGLAGLVSVAVGIGVLILGSSYLGWLPVGGPDAAGTWWNRAVTRALGVGGFSRVMLLGMLNGLLPCGLVYSALLLTASSGSLLRGGMGMALFGLGTLPALLILGLGASKLSVRARQTLSWVGGALILLVGVQLVLRGLAALSLVPHLQLGGWMLW